MLAEGAGIAKTSPSRALTSCPTLHYLTLGNEYLRLAINLFREPIFHLSLFFFITRYFFSAFLCIFRVYNFQKASLPDGPIR